MVSECVAVDLIHVEASLSLHSNLNPSGTPSTQRSRASAVERRQAAAWWMFMLMSSIVCFSSFHIANFAHQSAVPVPTRLNQAVLVVAQRIKANWLPAANADTKVTKPGFRWRIT